MILLTGAAGFIGWKTTEKLLQKGYRVIGIDNLNDYYDTKLKTWRVKVLQKHDNFLFFSIDVENFDDLSEIFKKNEIEAVINLAARAGVRYSIENPDVYFTTNVIGTLNLLKLCVNHDVKKFVLASTSSLYAGQPMPFNEDLPVNNPISPYAASKKSAEVLSYTYHYLYGLDVTILRYFTVYGPAGRPDMAYFQFIYRILKGLPINVYGDGTQSRDFTFVDDIAEGTILGLKELGFEIINLGGGKNPISINHMIDLISKYTRIKPNINYLEFNKADMKSTWADISKAERLLNWKPTVDFETGLKKTVDWFLQNKEFVLNLKI